MLSAPTWKSVGTTILCLLLLTVVLDGSRSTDPLPEEKAIREKSLPVSIVQQSPARVPALTAPAPTTEEQSIPPATDDSIAQQPPTLSPRDDEDFGTLAGGNKRPRIAIIIDDMGSNRQQADQFLQLDLNLTYSFLPDAPYTPELAETIFQAGRDILVHLPMEPKNTAINPGANALRVQDQPERIRQKMAYMLAAVPHAVGANNHMGSRFTENLEAMMVVIESLKNQSYFFIDSYSTGGSRGLFAARQQGLPSAYRHVFLDNIQEPQTICRQIERLTAGAKKRGWGIGIGHPNQALLSALNLCGREHLREVELVGAHQLVQ